MVFFAGDAEPSATISAPSSRGLGRRPLKAVTPVRIRSGLLGTRQAEFFETLPASFHDRSSVEANIVAAGINLDRGEVAAVTHNT
jgi:hypothetical protein